MTTRAKSTFGRALVGATLSLSMLGLPHPALAAGVATTVTAPAEASGTVLGLEGNEQMADALTGALRDAFAARGMTGGEPMSLVELRMTMGCEGNDPACLSEGAEAMDVDKLVFGAVRPATGGGYVVELKLLDARARKIENEISEEVGADQLGAGAMEETSRILAARLMGEDVEMPVTTEEISEGPAPKDGGSGGKLIWGNYSPRPTWKYGLLGASAALFVGSAVTAAVTSVMISPNGSVRKDLIAAAEDSLDDTKPSNDIDPNMDGDLCKAARAEPPGEPGTVTNAKVTEVCNRADTLSTVATATWITTGVFGAATVASVVLLFVHKDKPGVARLRRRGFQMGAMPTRGGAFVSGGFRF